MQELPSAAPPHNTKGDVSTSSDVLPNQAVGDGSVALPHNGHMGNGSDALPQHSSSVSDDASKEAIGVLVSRQTASASGTTLCALFACCGSLLELHSRASSAASRAHNAGLSNARKRKRADDRVTDAPSDALTLQPSVASRGGQAQVGRDQPEAAGDDVEGAGGSDGSQSSASDVVMAQEDTGTEAEDEGSAASGEESQGSSEEDVQEASEDQESGTEEENLSTEEEDLSTEEEDLSTDGEDQRQGPAVSSSPSAHRLCISNLEGQLAELTRMLCTPWSFHDQQDGVSVGSR